MAWRIAHSRLADRAMSLPELEGSAGVAAFERMVEVGQILEAALEGHGGDRPFRHG